MSDELSSIEFGADSFKKSTLCARVFENIASRVFGDYVELLIQ